MQGVSQQVACKLKTLRNTVACTAAPGRCHDTIQHFAAFLSYELQIHVLSEILFPMLKTWKIRNTTEKEKGDEIDG